MNLRATETAEIAEREESEGFFLTINVLQPTYNVV
jgi:hypothetical protein